MKTPSFKQHYERFLPRAQALSEEEVQICRADARVAFVNLKAGVENVLGSDEQVAFVEKHLPEIPLADVRALPDLGRALIFATGKVVGRVASAREIEAKLAAIREPREQMLDVAEVLAKRGKLDKDRVAKIRAGSGKYDSAHDVVTLVDLFVENATALAGQHPFTAKELDHARVDGEWLLEHLTPEGARVEKAKTKGAAEDVRDRLWTLIVRQHRALRKIGFYLYEDELDRYVPRLQSRVPGAAVELEEEEQPEPAPKPA
ncbi:Hypothetical protein A7982_06254 [Minicystis rosea]|nr:Hypothetical protein A7982_06254 [Minicystis rosea]